MSFCNRFIEWLAFGGMVRDGEEVRMSSLPSGMKCFHRCSEEDPDFNNEHIEIVWPNSADTTPQTAFTSDHPKIAAAVR